MEIEIIPFEKKYQRRFELLNTAWLEEHALIEQIDRDILANPEEYVFAHGGEIFLARIGEEIVGTAAILKEHDGIFELAKMCVAPEHQGKGIARLLVDHCMQRAATLGATKIVLFSSHKLAAALRLYEKVGFKYVALEDSPFLTADIKMEYVR